MARPRSADARAKMLRAAGEIIASDGVSACTVEEVARRSGVAKTTIYRHFGNSDALVLAVVDANVKEIEVPDTGSLRGDLMAVQRSYLDTARRTTSRELFAWMVTRSIHDPEFAAAFRRVRLQPRGPTVIALQRAIARGELDPTIDIEIAIHLIQGPFISKRIIDNLDLSERELETMVDFVVRALAAPAFDELRLRT